MAVSTAQINVKLPSDLKHEGDAALAEVGITASEIVRALWEALARRGAAREKVPGAIQEAVTVDELDPERQARLDAAARGGSIVARAMSELGIRVQNIAPLTDEELDDLRYEHLAQKGLQ